MKDCWADQMIKGISCFVMAYSGQALMYVHDVLSFVSVVCAAVLGLHGVYMIWKGWRNGR